MALAVVLAVVAVLFAIAGAIYLTKTAATIPGFLPGKELNKPKSHHTIRGVGALVVAVALFVVAGISVARSGRSKATAEA
jgi:amino acid permease